MSDIGVGRYRRAYPRIFRHPAFKQLSPLGQRLALYLLFGPQSNRIGLFYFSINTAAEDLKTSVDTLRKGMADICAAFGWLFDAVAGVFYIPTWWRWNDPGSPKVLQGNLKDLSEIPPCALLDAFAANLAYLPEALHHTFVEGIGIRMPKSTSTQYQYQVPVSKQKQEPAALRAVAANVKNKPKDNVPEVDSRVLMIAGEVIRDHAREGTSTTDDLIHALQWTCRQSNIEVNRIDALTALAQWQAQEGRTA